MDSRAKYRKRKITKVLKYIKNIFLTLQQIKLSKKDTNLEDKRPTDLTLKTVNFQLKYQTPKSKLKAK